MGAREDAREIQQLQRNLDGAPIRTQAATREYREGWERVFGFGSEKFAAVRQAFAEEFAAANKREKDFFDAAVKRGRAILANQRRRTARNGRKQP